ncbi:outer membrane beta-barrel protein [Paludibacter sp.]
MEDSEYMNELDDFSKLIKQKLEHHEMPVDAGVWKGIEKKINAPKRIIPRWAYITVSAAAGLALLISVGNFFNNRDTVIPISEEIKQYKEEVKELVVDDIKTDNNIVLVAEIKEEYESEKAIEIVEVKEETIKEDISVAENTNFVEVKEIRSKDKLQSLPEVQIQDDWVDNLPKKKIEPLTFAAALGSGVGSSSATMIKRSKAYRNESLVNLPSNVANVLTPNDFRHKEYLPPVSVGVNVRMPLARNVSVESGLVYTYLQTRLTNTFSGADYRAEVDLHYIGVPINFNYSFLQERGWEIYASAGGMLEKGLRSEFKQYQNWDNVRLDIDAATKVDGVQWSINGNIGVGYSFYKNISLFVEPKIAYYFDSDQPYSIRKEMPVLISINTGLRMSL